MERLPQNTSEKGDRYKEYIERIKSVYIQAAERYLEEGDPLRSRIVAYYSGRLETENELRYFFDKKSEGELKDYIQEVKEFTGNPARFIERMEKLYELHDVHRLRRELETSSRAPTKEEYELGAYIDVLESQVKNAVLVLQKKGYRTFQSGFREQTMRDQFIDFYTKNIVVPETAQKYLKERGVEVQIESFDDRTTLTLHPVREGAIRLAEWKEMWDTLALALPVAGGETVSGARVTGEHANFRKKHDVLRKL